MLSFVLNIILFYICVFTNTALALESSDRFQTQILKVYNKNILVLNRGLEDAIFRKDHIKLTSDDGFIARGICIKTTLLTSHWKIYRVVRPQLVSKDSLYTLRSINQSEIPEDLLKYSQVDFSKYFESFGDEDVTKELELQQERIAKYDLPTQAKQTRAFRKTKESDFERFIQKTFSDKEFKEDLSNFYLNIFASPISWQTRYNQKEINYGAKLYNIGKRYQFEINTIETQTRILDPVTQKGYNAKSTHQDISFQFNRLTSFLSVVSFFSYDREKIGNTYYPFSYSQIAILGLKLHIWEQDPKDNFFEVSYAPSLDDIRFTNPDDYDASPLRRQGIRHLLKVKIYSDLTPSIHSKTNLTYAPMESLNSNKYDLKDTRIYLSQIFSYKLRKKFFADYLLEYEVDELRKKVYDVSAHNTTQTFRLRYEFDL